MHACMHRYMYLQIRCCNCLLTCLFVEDGLTGSAWGDWATTARRAWIFPPTECRVFGLFMLQSSSEKVLNTRRATATIASKAAAKEDCRLPQQALSFLRHQDDHHSVCRYSLVYTTVDGENTAPPTWHVTIPQLPRTPFLTLFPVWMGRCKIAVVGSGPKDGVFMTTLQRGAGRDGIVCILSGARFPPST